MRFLVLLYFLLIFNHTSQAQFLDFKLPKKKEPLNCENGWCWGKTPEITKKRYALYNDAFKLKNYKEAKPHLEWLIQNVPYLNKSIYINGVRLYKALGKEEFNKETKKEYIEKEFQLYLMRDQYFHSKNRHFLNGSAFKLLVSRYLRILTELNAFEKIKEFYELVLSGNSIFTPDTSFIFSECFHLVRWHNHNLISDDFFYKKYLAFYEYALVKEKDEEVTRSFFSWTTTRKNLELLLINFKPYKDIFLKTGYQRSFYQSLNAKQQSLNYIKHINAILLADNYISEEKAHEAFLNLFTDSTIKVPNDLALTEKEAKPNSISIEDYDNQLKILSDSTISFRFTKEPQLGRVEERGDSLFIPIVFTKRVVHKTSNNTYTHRLYPLKLIYLNYKDQDLKIFRVELDSGKYKEVTRNYVKEREDEEKIEEKYSNWIWRDDPGLLKEKYALFSDAIKEERYSEAVEPLEWILDKEPDLNESIYIKGISAHKKLLKREENELEKIRLQDKILKLHDDRMKYFGDSANVLARKGALAYRYLNKRKGKNYKIELYDLYKTILELNGMNTSRSNLTFLFVIAQNMKLQKFISEGKFLLVHKDISKVIDFNIKISSEENRPKWEKTKYSLDGYLPRGPVITCEFIEDKLGPDIINKPNDIELQKRAIKYMLTGRCIDHPLFIIAAKNLHQVHPDLGLAKILANDFLKKEKYDSTIIFYNQAIDLAGNDQAKIGELTLDISKVEKARNNKATSRDYALEALELNPTLESEAYSLIGELYLSSPKECKQDNLIISKAYAFAAYEMFEKVNNTKGMEKVKLLFPTQEELNQSKYKVGDTISVGCWIGGEVKVWVKN